MRTSEHPLVWALFFCHLDIQGVGWRGCSGGGGGICGRRTGCRSRTSYYIWQSRMSSGTALSVPNALFRFNGRNHNLQRRNFRSGTFHTFDSLFTVTLSDCRLWTTTAVASTFTCKIKKKTLNMFHFRKKNLNSTARCDYGRSDEQLTIELFWFTADVITALTNLFQSVATRSQTICCFFSVVLFTQRIVFVQYAMQNSFLLVCLSS